MLAQALSESTQITATIGGLVALGSGLVAVSVLWAIERWKLVSLAEKMKEIEAKVDALELWRAEEKGAERERQKQSTQPIFLAQQTLEQPSRPMRDTPRPVIRDTWDDSRGLPGTSPRRSGG